MPDLHAPSIIMPDAGALDLRCGGCGSVEFMIHVKPIAGGVGARVHEIRCLDHRCGKRWTVDKEGRIETVGQITPNAWKRRLKERGNGKVES